MKKYKVLTLTASASFETSLNDLANAGWKVISANLAYDNTNSEPTYFALLENIPLETELKHLLEEEPKELDNLNSISPSAN